MTCCASRHDLSLSHTHTLMHTRAISPEAKALLTPPNDFVSTPPLQRTGGDGLIPAPDQKLWRDAMRRKSLFFFIAVQSSSFASIRRCYLDGWCIRYRQHRLPSSTKVLFSLATSAQSTSKENFLVGCNLCIFAKNESWELNFVSNQPTHPIPVLL